MAEALYTKYRPQVFNDMVGQEHIERTIKNAIEHDKVSHAYLFTGPRGTGKTTTARLLAKHCCVITVQRLSRMEHVKTANSSPKAFIRMFLSSTQHHAPVLIMYVKRSSGALIMRLRAVATRFTLSTRFICSRLRRLMRF